MKKNSLRNALRTITPTFILALIGFSVSINAFTQTVPDPMEASLRAKADLPPYVQFMVSEKIVEGFPNESEADRIKRVQPWADAKFGLFLHWGPQNGGGGDSSVRNDILNVYNPVKFNAEKWVLTAKRLGFKYIVYTAKHRAGFCMFDSKYTDHDIVDATPFGRDPLKELADACAKHNMLLGIYYAVWDLHHPDYDTNPGNPNYHRYHQYMLDQAEELLSNYGPIATWWLDAEYMNTWTVERAMDYRDHIRKLQPDILLNDRIGQLHVGSGDYCTTENFTPYIGNNMNRLWESCQMFDGRWFYDGTTTSKSLEWALFNLVYTVSRGGNFLMNLGPTREGELLPTSVEKLEPLGEWLRQNGESIYGAEKGPHYMLDWGTCSRKGNTLYYHVFSWPADGKLVIPGLNGGKPNAGITKISFLADEEYKALSFEQKNGDAWVSVPGKAPYALANVLKVELNGPPEVDNAIRVLKSKLVPQTGTPDIEPGSFYLSPAFAEIHGETLHFFAGSGAGAQRENLKNWVNDSDWAEWQIVVEKSGNYELSITFSSWMESGDFVVDIEGQSFKHTIAPTEGEFRRILAKTFQTQKLGVVNIKEPGRYSVSVKALEIKEKAIKLHQGLMTLREITLVPN